jgi:hypothetical protein
MIMKDLTSYTKRHYSDVADSFKHLAKSPYASILGVIPLTKKVSLGVNRNGIWLWHIEPQKLSLRIVSHNCQFGFFEWKWISNIQFSYSQKVAYFSFNDLDAVLKQVVLADKDSFEKQFVTTLEGVRMIRFPVTSDKQFAIFEHLLQRRIVPVYAIE